MLRRVISVGRSAGGRLVSKLFMFFGRFIEHNSDPCCQILMKLRINTGNIYTKVHAKAQLHGYHMNQGSGAGQVCQVERFLVHFREIHISIIECEIDQFWKCEKSKFLP